MQQNAFLTSCSARICQMLKAIQRHSSHVAYIEQGRINYISHSSVWQTVIQCYKLLNAKGAEMEMTAILLETVE